MLIEVRQLGFCIEDTNKIVKKLINDLQNNNCEDESKASEALGRLVMARMNMYRVRELLKEAYKNDEE